MGKRPAAGIAGDRTGRLVLLANRLELSYWAIRLGGTLAERLPRRVAYALADALADAVWAFWGGIRRRTVENMRWVVGPRAEPVGRQAFRNYFEYLVEFLRFGAMSPAELDRAVAVRGVEHLHAALALGRGAVAVGFHIGYIDLGAAVLARQGYPVQVVVDRFEPPRLDRLIQGVRVGWGLKLIPLDEAPRRALKVLRAGEVLALLIDRPTPGEGVVVDFFGGPIEIPAGAALLALRTGAPVVPCRVSRRRGRFEAEVAPFIDPADEAGAGSRDGVRALTQRIVGQLEQWVREEPAQWYPFRRMWLETHQGGAPSPPPSGRPHPVPSQALSGPGALLPEGEGT
jgi:lauroyl/myristoyl acyltransferase